MRLLNVDTLQLEYFHNAKNAGPYAILSHTWEEEEVLFDDMHESPQDKEIVQLSTRVSELETYIKNLNQSPGSPALPDKAENSFLHRARKKKGWMKVEGCCKQAARFGMKYVWIDTCCICKSDSSELSEAINSMFTWYAQADVCFAFLGDIMELGSMSNSRWFTRGWTLQELLAPKQLLFYQSDWLPLGSRSSLAHMISSTTRIPHYVLDERISQRNRSQFSVAIKMGWAAKRRTTRPEDQAYCLMGLFQINMPTIYGEGEESALFRLQSEIFRKTGDHSILAWSWNGFIIDRAPWQPRSQHHFSELSSCNLLATRVGLFSPNRGPDIKDAQGTDILKNIYPLLGPDYPGIHSKAYSSEITKKEYQAYNPSKYSAAKHGICVRLLLERLFEHSDMGYLAHLACVIETPSPIHGEFTPNTNHSLGILLKSNHLGTFERVFPNLLIAIPPEHKPKDLSFQDIFLTQRLDNRPSVPVLMPEYWSIKGQYIVQICSEDFAKARIALKAHSECNAQTSSTCTQLDFDQKDDYMHTQTNMILFKDIVQNNEFQEENTNFAIRWLRYRNGKMLLGINMDLPPSTTLASALSLEYTTQAFWVRRQLKLLSSEMSRRGICVVVGLRRVDDNVLMQISISRTEFDGPAPDQQTTHQGSKSL